MILAVMTLANYTQLPTSRDQRNRKGKDPRPRLGAERERR